MIYGSLFTGIGIFDLALESCGMEPAFQVEIDPQCCSVLSRHWPYVRRDEDVTKVDPVGYGPVHILCGGFPCQDLSVAGQRAGLAGKRSGLFFEFIRFARALAPEWLLLENVPGLLTSAGGRDMRTVIRELTRLGYCVAWRVLNARYFHLAQNRERVFLVGHLGSARRAAQVLFEPESCERDFATCGEAGAEVAGTLGAGSKGSGWRDDLERCGTFVADDYKNGSFEATETARPITRSPDRSRAAPLAVSLRSRQSTKGVSAPGRGGEDGQNLVVASAQPSEQKRLQEGDNYVVAHALRSEGVDASEDGTGRGTPLFAFQTRIARNGRGQPAPVRTMIAGAGYRVRRLTPRECERLQGIPDDWTAVGANGETISDSARYRMIGNAVPRPVVEWIGRRIMEAAQ